jgi:NAD-dependent SIR2 family protein deacetylase
LKGEKGDIGSSCSSACSGLAQVRSNATLYSITRIHDHYLSLSLSLSRFKSNVKVFSTLQQALSSLKNLADHTYVHIVNDYGKLQGVFIHMHGQLIPIRLDNEVLDDD